MKEIVSRIRMLGEIYSKQLSEASATYFARGLSQFPEAHVVKALDRCLVECRRFPSIAEIIERLDDGRPGVNEAWALIPLDESVSVVMNDEIAAAYGVARPLLVEGQKTQAFFAFKERYEADVAAARLAGKPAKWWPSLGHSVAGRKAALLEAVSKGRLTLPEAQSIVPELPAPKSQLPRLPEIPPEGPTP